MRTIYHHFAQRATIFYNNEVMSHLGPLVKSYVPPLQYPEWLAEQGATIRIDPDNRYWIDFEDEKEYLMFVLRWMW